MVELLRRYSNRPDLLEPLVEVVRRIEANDQTDEPGLAEPHVVTDGRWSLAGSLTSDDLRALIEEYRAGVTARELAERFSVCHSTIKRLLRLNGVRKRKPPP